jgi:LysR family transcriptional regulator of abg operon
MDTRQLKHLVALVENGTVHAAAQDLFISQPGLSSSIKRLEAHLGMELFERDSRGMRPNSKGREFYQHAKHILEQLRLATADLENAPSRVFIGLGEVRPSDFSAVLYDALLESYPELSITFVEGHFDTLYAQVEQGDVDVAFIAAPPEGISPTLQGKPLVKTEWRVICAADHPLTCCRGRVPVAELEKYTWVKNAMAPVMSPYVPFLAGRKKNLLHEARYVTAGSHQMGKDLVMNSMLLGYGPRVAFDVELAAGEVVELNLPITKQYATIMQIRRRNVRSAILDSAFTIAEDYYQNRRRG